MLTVEELNRVTMAALAGQQPSERGLPDTDEVRASYDDAVAWVGSLPEGAQADMVNEWPDADLDAESLYGESAADLAARIFGGGDEPPPEGGDDDTPPPDAPPEPPEPETKASGGVDKNRGGAEKLRRYWVRGEGAAKIAWGTPGDFDRCVAELSKYMGTRAKGYCNLRHHDALGQWPGEHAAGKSVTFNTETKTWDESLHPRIEDGRPGGGRFTTRGGKNDGSERTDVGEQGVRDWDELTDEQRTLIRTLVNELTDGGDRDDLTEAQRAAIRRTVDGMVDPKYHDSQAAPVRPLQDLTDKQRERMREIIDSMTGDGRFLDLPETAREAILRSVRALMGVNRRNAEKGLPFVDTKGLLQFKADGNLSAQTIPDGVMVALYAPDEVAAAHAVDGGTPPPDMHVTLAYLGKVDEVPDPSVLMDVVSEFAANHDPIDAEISGTGRFVGGSDGDVAYLSVDSPALPEFRHNLVSALEAAGLPVRKDHGFTPHITLSYLDPEAPDPISRIDPATTQFGLLSMAYGPDVWDFPMGATE